MDYLSVTPLSDILANLEEFPTSIGLLRLRGDMKDNQAIVELHDTFGDDILDHIIVKSKVHPCAKPGSKSGLVPTSQSLTQILFLKSIRDQDGCTTNRLQVKRHTLEEICNRLGINSSFMEAVSVPSIWSKQSCGSFHRLEPDDNRRALDGFYHYFENWELGPLHLWFSYDPFSRSTTYLLIDCPERSKEIIERKAQTKERDFLLQPLAIDYLIAEECASWREVYINTRWKKVFDWRDTSGNKMDPPILTQVLDPQNLQNLHELLRTWNMLYEDLADLEERLDFLIDVAAQLGRTGVQRCSYAVEAFRFLRARNHVRQRWVTSFGHRTKSISTFVFSLEAQKVNQATLDNAEENKKNTLTNIKIQDLTAKIAYETAKDNSSMITIATMTMVFLPGTFISAIFSMAFFSFGDDGSSLTVSPWIWIYFAITVPVTAVVICLYLYWRRKRAAKKRGKQQDIVDIETGNKLLSSNEIMEV